MSRGGPSIRLGRGASAVLALLALLALAPAAWAGRLVVLKAEVSSGASITLGDLFDGAGAEAPVVVGHGAPPGESAVLDAAVVRELARGHGLDWDNPGAISRIVVPRGAVGAAGPHMVEALTYATSLSSGDLIRPEDLTYGKVASFAVPPDAPRDADQVIGKVARRPLRAGSAVASRDVTDPQVIKANDTVQVIYRADGISLVLQGVAMGSAALGDPVEIMNPVSKKAIQAIASGADEAVIGPGAEQLRARSVIPTAEVAALR